MLPESSVSRWSQIVLKRLGLSSTLPAALPYHPREVTERHEQCEEHEVDGHKFWRCSEMRQRFRLCMDGQRELLETTTAETIRPAWGGVPSPAGVHGINPMQEPLLGSHIEQLLDEFVEYAIGLQSKLQAADAGLPPPAPRPSSQQPLPRSAGYAAAAAEPQTPAAALLPAAAVGQAAVSPLRSAAAEPEAAAFSWAVHSCWWCP